MRRLGFFVKMDGISVRWMVEQLPRFRVQRERECRFIILKRFTQSLFI